MTIALVGAPVTGKSTVAGHMAEHHGALCIEEVNLPGMGAARAICCEGRERLFGAYAARIRPTWHPRSGNRCSTR